MKKAILIVSFGTSHKDAREKSLDCILQDIAKYVNGTIADEMVNQDCLATSKEKEITVYQAYTSGMIIRALANEGVRILTVEEAVERILADGCRELIVVSTHMIPGIEYHKMLEALNRYRSSFDRLTVTPTVLEKQQDCDILVDVLRNILRFSPEKEYILMGHGTEADANVRYHQMQEALIKAGLDNVHIASVEAKPDLEEVMERLDSLRKRRGAFGVVVQPFMVVAGEHAKQDMAGEKDSYVARLREAGFQVEVVIAGLGEYPEFRNIYLERLQKVMK
ncbi:MAG: sirohydrochlorin cobaltochelatase [Lachnospiraceae bacterium]|nr:sirohydrochlorin cobaltochelatase [Lachnospiraceae bacterium]